MEHYRKLFVALAGVVAAIATALADWNVDAQEWGIIGGALAVAYGVYKARNVPLVTANRDPWLSAAIGRTRRRP